MLGNGNTKKPVKKPSNKPTQRGNSCGFTADVSCGGGNVTCCDTTNTTCTTVLQCCVLKKNPSTGNGNTAQCKPGGTHTCKCNNETGSWQGDCKVTTGTCASQPVLLP
jgi:hypothetical protein